MRWCPDRNPAARTPRLLADVAWGNLDRTLRRLEEAGLGHPAPGDGRRGPGAPRLHLAPQGRRSLRTVGGAGLRGS